MEKPIPGTGARGHICERRQRRSHHVLEGGRGQGMGSRFIIYILVFKAICFSCVNITLDSYSPRLRYSSSVCIYPFHYDIMIPLSQIGEPKVNRTLFPPKESGVIENAHESIVWALSWHPIGHILCSGSNDHTAKFW